MKVNAFSPGSALMSSKTLSPSKSSVPTDLASASWLFFATAPSFGVHPRGRPAPRAAARGRVSDRERHSCRSHADESSSAAKRTDNGSRGGSGPVYYGGDRLG